ncbi:MULTISPECIES: MobA/MobL family protein [Terrabacteria group]|uniref:MobA/MobL family protein n=1 Tax=Bacillati TaxID=1783272 RepID=UPI001C6EF880|nr:MULTISPECIES: MobA/MobL family protein [Terrabacteria group]MBW9212971.1 MobA/MobL family protein [Trueperella sp. zg.1013]
MAIYHLCIKIISRGKGKSAVAASAYRSGEKIKNEYDGIVHDFTRKGGIVHTEILLPQNALQEFTNRSALWNSVEKIEKSKQEDFYNEHTAEIILFESAKKYLKEHLGENKTLNISKWKSEVATLKKGKNSLYNQILRIREEVKQAEKVKTCIDKLLQENRGLIQVKRNELDL